MSNNLALGFIKPHASKSVATWNWIQATLKQRGIRLSAETAVTGPQIREKGLIDRHYTVIAHVGGCHNPMELALNDNAHLARLNPVIALDGKTASAIDHLEDTDTPQTAAMIRRLIH
jgi:hypothetical protein